MLFRAEDTSRANYRSLFEYAVGDEARLAQDRRLAYYEQVLPKMLARVKGLPLMYQTYSKQWTPESPKDAFIVKRRVPDLSKPIYITDDEGNKVQKGFETQDLVVENDEDIAAFMTRKGRFKGQHGFNKGFSYLAPIYHVQRDEMPFIQVDLDIDQADFGKQAWSRLLRAVEQVYTWFKKNGYDPLINFTGSSFHVWAKDGQIRTYAETKEVLQELSQATDLPLAAGAAHVAGQITIDYPQNKYRAPLRFPLSIHGDTGLVSIIIPRNQLRRFDPLQRAHPDEVLKRLPKELDRIDAWFSDLSTTTTKQAEETFYAESRKMKELKNRIRIQLAKLDEPLPDSANRGTPRRLFYKSVRDSYGKTRYVPSIQQIGLATRQVEREMSAESQSSAADIIQRRLDELSDADKERCIWGDCGILADQLMKALQQAGHTDAVYELGLAYIHPFEDYENKDYIGGHIVVTVDGESYDALGAGAKERWVEGPVIRHILADSGFTELGPLLSAHLTVNWVSSTWEEVMKNRQDSSAAFKNWNLSKEAESSQTWYSSGNVHPWQLFLDTETLGADGRGERDNYPYEDMKALESKYGLKPTSAVIWVSAKPEVAASYMIGQGIIHNSDEDVEDVYGFSKSDLETTEFGQVYYPPHVDEVNQYQGIVIRETDDGDGGYLLSLNRDYTGQYGLKRIGMAAETEYKKKRQKPTPEPGVEGGTDLKPSRLKPPMKVKGSNVYSVQKHRATMRGSHRDIRIGLDGTLLSFVPVGRYEKKDDDGKWQKTDGSRLPKKIGDGVSVIRTEDHPFDYWWFEGEIPKDSYGAGPVSLETHGTRRIIEWKPDEKLKVEFIGGKYAGTYTFERSKKSKDGKVWWMRKSRPVPEDKTDKKTKKAEITDNRYDKLNFTRAFSNWNVTSNNRNYSPATRYIENLLEEAQYMQGKIILYRAIRLANPEDFDPTETGESWTPNINFAEPYFGYNNYSKNHPNYYTIYETYILMALVPVESIDWKESVARALEFGPPSDEKEIVLKRGAGIELINLPMELSFAIDATPEALIRAAEEKWYGPPALEAVMNEDVRDQYGYSMFSKALAEWSEKFLAGEGNAKDMIERAYYDDGAGSGDGFIVDYDPSHGMVDIELGDSSHYGLPASEAVERFARRYVEELLISAKYHRGRIKLYRGIQLVNPEDFDPTEVGQSWTPIKRAAKPYFGFHKYYSRNLERIYPTNSWSKTYVLTALVPVESINWYYTLMRALSFGISDEKEIVLKGGASIELVDIPLDLSFAIDGTPEALIRAAEEDDEDWWFTMNTPLGPDEEFGPYDSHEDALKGIERVMQKVISLEDGYTREFPRAYQGRRGAGFGLRAEDEDIDLTVGEAFDKALAEIQADVEAVQPRSKDLSEVTLEDYEKTKQVYQRFMIPAGITGSIVRDEWWYESEPIYLWSDMFTLPAGAEEEWQQKIDAQKTGTESDIFASDEINYAFYWFAVLQINSIYNWLLSRLGERKMYTGVYTGPPVELPNIIESQRDETEVEIYRWLATSQDDEPVRRLRNRMRPVDLNYYGGYAPNVYFNHNPVDSPGNLNVSVRKGLEALSYGPCWSLSPDAYTRTDQWRLAQEDVVLKEREVRVSPFEKAWRTPTEEEIDVRTYVIEKSIPASALDWYSTLISSALWLDSPEYEVIPKRGVFLSEEITDSSDFEQEFNKVAAEVTELFKEFSWWSDNQKELYDVSDLHKDAAGYARLGELESHLAMLTRPGSLLWSSGDDSAYDAYPGDLQNPTYVFEYSGIYVDGEDDWETDGYTDEERGEPGEEIYGIQDRPKSPDYDIRLRYAYTLNCLSQLAEQYFSRLDELRSVLKPQFDSGRVTIYRALALTEKQRPKRRRQTIFPMSMRMSGSLTRYWENPEIREKYTYESYGKHWSLIPGFEWSDDFPSYSGGRAVTIEKQIPYTEVDWFNTLLIMAYGREPEFEVAVNENVFLAETIDEPHLYLDMDGCFADFAGAITERVNDVLQVQDVSEISSKSLRRAARKAKELGITSVTEWDFDLSLSHDPIKKKVIDRMLYKIASEPDFFYNLEVINRDVLDEIIASGRPFSFLSAPIGGTNDYSIEDKRAWVRDRLGLDVEVIVVPREQKVDYCQPGDVLLDDHAGTIAEWREAGGVGIWFPHERI